MTVAKPIFSDPLLLQRTERPMLCDRCSLACPLRFLVQRVVGVSLHPAIAPHPHRPVRLHLLRERPKPLLQQRQALLQFLRSQDERDAHEPRTNVEIIHSRTGPADEGSLRGGSGERLDDEVLDAVPEGIGGGKSALFGIVGSSAVENCVRA